MQLIGLSVKAAVGISSRWENHAKVLTIPKEAFADMTGAFATF
jgi:hypothetical protein